MVLILNVLSNRSEIYLNVKLFDSYLCEYAVCVAQDVSGVGIIGDLNFDRTDINFGTKCPKVRLLNA